MHAKTQIRRTIMLILRAGTPNQSWRDVLDEVRKLTSRTGTGRTKLLRKLDELDLAVTCEIESLDDARRRRIIGSRARVRSATYTAEESRSGPALVEIRPDATTRPYKVPLPYTGRWPQRSRPPLSCNSSPPSRPRQTAGWVKIYRTKSPEYRCDSGLSLGLFSTNKTVSLALAQGHVSYCGA